MENMCLDNSSMKGKLPLLNIKQNEMSKNNLFKSLPAYLSNDIIINLQECNDALISSHKGQVSNVWSSSKRREKFKHISDNPICICGSGKDLTFLYDKLPNQLNKSGTETTNKNEKVKKIIKRNEDKTIIKIPEKIFPAEFTLSIHHGTKSIQLYDEKFATKPVSHNNHRICLPRMIPNKISNSKKTYSSLHDILQKSGLKDSPDLNLPTVLHNLLLLVKKEQDLYNIIFHGIIKETTVDCIERGELLSNIRQRYRNIFIRVPEIIKDFHDQIIARKMLDRRLTEELMRFQNTVSELSSELFGIKTHEDKVNQLCQKAGDQLKNAVEETKANTDLLGEYHDLYEQQRQRLEKTVIQLETEKDCWRTASYEITQLVLNHYDIKPGISLVECEYNAMRLSEYFLDLLTTTDNQALGIIKTKVSKWCNEAQKFSLMLAMRDENFNSVLISKIEQINQFKKDFEDEYMDGQGRLLEPLGIEETKKILKVISEWEKSLSDVIEILGGQSMLIEEEKIRYMKKICSEFTDEAIEVFNRHRNETDGSLYHEHFVLFEINKMVDKMMNQFMDQLSGDNGVANGIITVQTFLEHWTSQLSNRVMQSYFRPMPDSEWNRFVLLLDDWMALLDQSKNSLGSVKSTASSIDGLQNKKLDVHQIIQSVDTWNHKSFSGIESENLKLREAIINLKQNMIRWTSQVILRLAPDYPTNSTEAKRATRMASASLQELQENSEILHNNLSKLMNYIVNCSKDIVTRLVQMEIDTQNESLENDKIKLQQLMDFSKSWIEISQEVLREVMEIEYKAQTGNESAKDTVSLSDSDDEPSDKGTEDNKSENIEDDVEDLDEQITDNSDINIIVEDEKIVEISEPPPTVEGVGVDFNVHSKLLIQDPDKPYSGNQFQNVEQIDLPSDLPQTNEAFQLIQIFEILQEKFRSLNAEAIITENKCTVEELEVAKSKAYLDSQEQIFEKLTKELEQMHIEKDQVLPRPTLLSLKSNVEKTLLESTDSNLTPRSAASRHRTPRHTKRNIKK